MDDTNDPKWVSEDLPIQDLYNEYTADSLVTEGTARPTLPTGTYQLTIKRYSARIATERSPWPGRKTAWMNADASFDGVRRGPISFDVSWQVDGFRTSTGKLDTPARLWTHLIAALDAKGKSNGEVLDLATKYPVDASISEVFNLGPGLDGKNTYKQAGSPEERKAFFEKGYAAFNKVTSIRKVR